MMDRSVRKYGSLQPRYGKGETRILFLKCSILPNRYNLRNRSLRNVHIFIHVHLYCSKHDAYSDSPPKTSASAGPSPFSIRNRHNLHTSSSSSSSGTGARVHQGLGSRGNVRIHRAQVSVVEAASSIVLTVSLPVSPL